MKLFKYSNKHWEFLEELPYDLIFLFYSILVSPPNMNQSIDNSSTRCYNDEKLRWYCYLNILRQKQASQYNIRKKRRIVSLLIVRGWQKVPVQKRAAFHLRLQKRRGLYRNCFLKFCFYSANLFLLKIGDSYVPLFYRPQH